MFTVQKLERNTVLNRVQQHISVYYTYIKLPICHCTFELLLKNFKKSPNLVTLHPLEIHVTFSDALLDIIRDYVKRVKFFWDPAKCWILQFIESTKASDKLFLIADVHFELLQKVEETDFLVNKLDHFTKIFR